MSSMLAISVFCSEIILSTGIFTITISLFPKDSLNKKGQEGEQRKNTSEVNN